MQWIQEVLKNLWIVETRQNQLCLEWMPFSSIVVKTEVLVFTYKAWKLQKCWHTCIAMYVTVCWHALRCMWQCAANHTEDLSWFSFHDSGMLTVDLRPECYRMTSEAQAFYEFKNYTMRYTPAQSVLSLGCCFKWMLCTSHSTKRCNWVKIRKASFRVIFPVVGTYLMCPQCLFLGFWHYWYICWVITSMGPTQAQGSAELCSGQSEGDWAERIPQKSCMAAPLSATH